MRALVLALACLWAVESPAGNVTRDGGDAEPTTEVGPSAADKGDSEANARPAERELRRPGRDRGKLDSFVPTEKIHAGDSVPFPADI